MPQKRNQQAPMILANGGPPGPDAETPPEEVKDIAAGPADALLDTIDPYVLADRVYELMRADLLAEARRRGWKG